MTVVVQTPYNAHVANGVTTTYGFTFQLLAASDLQVSLDGVVQTTGFTIAGIGVQAGGNINFAVAPDDNVLVEIQRAIPLARGTDYQQNGDLPSDTVDEDFDRLWQALQDAAYFASLTIGLPPGDTAAPVTVPSVSNRANSVLAFDGSGNAIAIPTADVSTVAGSIANVNTVAGSIASVNTVAGIAADVVAVAADQADIGTVAASIASVNTVSGAIADVSTVATDIADVSAVATNIADVTALAAEIPTFASFARLGEDQTFTAANRGTVTTDNDLSFDLAVTNNFTCTPSGAGTLTFTNIASAGGQSGLILLNNTGAQTISAAATTKVSATFLTTVSAAGVYLLTYFCDGTNVYVVASGALA